MTLPAIGLFDVPSKVTSVTIDRTQSECYVHVCWRDAPKPFLQGLAEFLLFGDTLLTPACLRRAGFIVRDISRTVSYAEATEQELRDILKLRLRAHQHEGRCCGLGSHDLSAPFDVYSSHLVCRFGKKIVSYVRLINVGCDPDRSQYIVWGKHQVPGWLMRAGFAEAGAGATDPEFQRCGLFLPLMQFAVAKTVELGYRFILGACEDNLLAMYREMGFALIETREVNPRHGWKFVSHLIYLDTHDLLVSPPGGRWVGAMAKAAEFSRSILCS
jgi:hypothetical protein